MTIKCTQSTDRDSDQRVALVTGASTGIGKAIARTLAGKGVTVLVTSRDGPRLENTYQELRRSFDSIIMIPADLNSVAEIEKLVQTVKKKVDRLDILVNAAGVYHDEDTAFYDIDFTDYPQDVIMETYNVGVVAPTLLAHGLLPIIPKGGKIINISGTFENGALGWLPYYVSKKALEDLTVGLAQELRKRQIQINCIAPADTLTESYQKFFSEFADPEKNLDPAEIADLTTFLISDQADNLTGQIIEIRHKRAC